MSTDYLADYRIVDSGDPDFPLTSTVFGSKLEAAEWVRAHEADLHAAIEAGSIGGFCYRESRTPARFIVTTDAATPYLNFGARVVSTIYAGAPLRIVGVPVEHTDYLMGRLASGLVGRAGPFDSLEAAEQRARLGL